MNRGYREKLKQLSLEFFLHNLAVNFNMFRKIMKAWIQGNVSSKLVATICGSRSLDFDSEIIRQVLQPLDFTRESSQSPNSASDEDLDTNCFFDFQLIKEEPRQIQNPVVDIWFEGIEQTLPRTGFHILQDTMGSVEMVFVEMVFSGSI